MLRNMRLKRAEIRKEYGKPWFEGFYFRNSAYLDEFTEVKISHLRFLNIVECDLYITSLGI